MVLRKNNDQRENLYKELIKAIAEVRGWCGEKYLKIISIDISAPGLMDSSTGRIVEASNLDWHNLNLNELLEQEFNLPVSVENDTNAAAYGEFLYGSEHEEPARNMLYIAVGTGVGAGLIIDRALYKGSQGMAGEIGHIVVNENGQMCACGKKGCLETVVSELAILREYKSKVNEPNISIHELVQRSETGDTLAREVLFNAGRTLGTVVGNQVNVLNFDSVVFGGDAITSGHVMFSAIAEGLNEALLPGLERNCIRCTQIC